MSTNHPFGEHEACDGGFCEIADECCRYIGNIEITRFTSGVIFMKKRWPFGCPFFLDRYENNGTYPIKADAFQSDKTDSGNP